jgi:hypothetical protein
VLVWVDGSVMESNGSLASSSRHSAAPPAQTSAAQVTRNVALALAVAPERVTAVMMIV